MVIAWMPFFVTDRATFTPHSYAQAVDPASALRALGVGGGAGPMPDWVRPTQVLLSISLATLVLLRGRWQAALPVALGVRIALDPSAYGYYTPTLLVGALAWDLLGSKRPLPIWTIVTYVGLTVVPWLAHDPAVIGRMRLITAAALVAGTFLLSLGSRNRATNHISGLPRAQTVR
jgi:hypothetical protein